MHLRGRGLESLFLGSRLIEALVILVPVRRKGGMATTYDISLFVDILNSIARVVLAWVVMKILNPVCWIGDILSR